MRRGDPSLCTPRYRNVVRSNAVLEVGDTPKDGVPLSILHRIPGGIAPPSSAVHRKRKSPPPALRRQPSLLEKAEASAASIMQKKASARDLARSESKASIAEETGPSENETDSDDWKSVPLTDEEGDSGSRDDDDPDVANDPGHGAEGLESDSKSADNPTPSLIDDKPTAPASGSSTSGSPSKGTDTGLDGADLSRGSVAEGGDSDAGSSVQGGEQAITVDLSNLDNLGELGGIAKPTDDTHDLDEEELNIPVRATTPRTAGLMKATDMGLTPMITGLHKISQGIVNIRCDTRVDVACYHTDSCAVGSAAGRASGTSGRKCWLPVFRLLPISSSFGFDRTASHTLV